MSSAADMKFLIVDDFSTMRTLTLAPRRPTSTVRHRAFRFQ